MFVKNLVRLQSPGADGILPTILKTCFQSIAKPLKIIFEKPLREGKNYQNGERERVTPIFKKRCRLDKKKTGQSHLH